MSVGFVWFKIEPLSVDRSRLTYSLFSYDQEKEQSAKQSLEFMEKILEQDFTILEAQQKKSSHPQTNHYTGYERLIGAFHQNIHSILSFS